LLKDGIQREENGLARIIKLHKDITYACAERSVGSLPDYFGDAIGERNKMRRDGRAVISQPKPRGEGKLAGRTRFPS
jgi:hypothetical protein